MVKPPAKKASSPKKEGLGKKGKKTTSAAAKKAAAALKSVTSSQPITIKSRKKPGPKPGSKRGMTTATGAPRKKPGPKPGTKRGPMTAAGTPRKKPGPKTTKKSVSPAIIAKAKAKTLTTKSAPQTKKSQLKPPVTTKPAVQKTKSVKRVAKKTSAKPATLKKMAQTQTTASVQKTVPAKVQKTSQQKPVATVKTFKTAPPARTSARARQLTALETSAKKPSKAKRPSKATSATQIETLRTRVYNIQARLKKSDVKTRKNINTLERAFATLQAKVRTGSSENADLSQQVSLLSGKIEGITKSAHADVNAALSDALSNPSSGNLTEALTRAEHRLVAAETAQSASIAKVNRHIADMALAIDARFKKEALANADVISKLGNRITSVENESAAAISTLGEKVVAISSEFGQRAQDSEAIIKEKVSEIALKTQEEFEHYRANLERQIETLASEHNQVRSKLDSAMLGLSSRVEGLEHIATHTDATETSSATTEFYPSAVLPESVQRPKPEDFDAFAPEPTQLLSKQIVPPNPYAAPAPNPEPVTTLTEAHIPAEFDPNKVIQGSFDTQNVPTPTPLAIPATVPAPLITTSALVSKDTAPHYSTANTYETAMPGDVPMPELSMPYGDPAYAETSTAYEPSMDQARPGDFGTEKKGLSRPKFNLSNRNKKIAGLALGVAVVALIGSKTLMGKSDSKTMVAENSINRNLENTTGGLQSGSFSNNNEPIILETTAPTIGDYDDNKVDTTAMGSAEALTLEAAATNGNPVAQYQLGISYLENGRMNEAVKLIRSASDNGQPAAQYRLAKLYETGEGVAQNEGMARQLTERAARSGNRIAMHDLALYHAEGRGGIQMNLDTAAKWFEKAAERGVVDSQFNLGVMYETGKGVPKSLTDAYVWYSIAATQGDQFAKERLGVLETQMNSARLTAAEARANNFTPSKIDQAANGIFANLPWDTQKSVAAPQTDPRVKGVQVMLTGLGFDTGGVDGSIGPKTRTAIVSFQKANGLPETGQVDEALINRLEFASGA